MALRRTWCADGCQYTYNPTAECHPYPYQLQQVAQQILYHRDVPGDRLIVSAAGGIVALAGIGHVEKPPPETGL